MAEKVLPYDRGIVPQETYYWCGPASTQVVLSGRGIHVSEQDMANTIGTTENGTDYVGLIAPVLNAFCDGAYIVRTMPNDPPTPAQVELLWSDIAASIDAGYGVVANIVAPPSNYPRGVKGSQSPAYAGGVVYHYIALMGYDDGPERAVWVADSGFRPFGYWMAFEQLASLIPPKGYTAAPSPADRPTKPEHPAEPMPAALTFGVDISNHQGGLDLSAVAAEGFEFVIAKVSEGDYFRDPEWPRFRDETLAAGKILVGYHYVRADCDIEGQAELFVEHLGDPGIVGMLDHEANSGGVDVLRALHEAIERRGIHIGLTYLPRWYWDQIGRPDLSGLPPLMSSHYGPQPGRAGYASAIYPGHDDIGWAPYGGVPVAIFQFSERGLVAGRSIDVDAFQGTPDQLRNLLTGGDIDMTPEQERMLVEVHRELTQQYPSRSAHRLNDDPVDTLAGIALNVDGRVHEASIDVPAALGRIEQALADLPAKIATAIRVGQ
ncbi:C39 family peptidase [Nocardia sp. NPDC050630]|uniref:C39 family peptidase n=1 Tax=Nocardia sp. NPDC050630 TaxID=3364321 RepID=UPI0037B45266